MRDPLLRLAALLGGLAAATVVAGATHGYLSAVGPAPLRFQVPRPPTVASALPPLPKEDAAAAAESPAAAATEKPAAPAKEFPATAPPTVAAPPGLVAGRPAPTNLTEMILLPGAPASPPMTAQMLLPYFTAPLPHGTNAGTAVIVPLNFAPPLPAGVPASRATYSTNP